MSKDFRHRMKMNAPFLAFLPLFSLFPPHEGNVKELRQGRRHDDKSGAWCLAVGRCGDGNGVDAVIKRRVAAQYVHDR